MRMLVRGIVVRSKGETLAQSILKSSTYNLIWSPGKKIFGKLFLDVFGF